jgi:hypothetical protein
MNLRPDNFAARIRFHNMDTQTESQSGPSAAEKLHHYYEDGEQYVRRNPTKSALVGVGVGFLLAQLPVRFMLLAFVKLILLLVKPATFIYAISKLVDDVRGDQTAGR